MRVLRALCAALVALFDRLCRCPRCGAIVWTTPRGFPHCPCPDCGLRYCPGGVRCYDRQARQADLLRPWREL